MRPDYQNYGSWFIHTEIVKAVKVDFSNPTIYTRTIYLQCKKCKKLKKKVYHL